MVQIDPILRRPDVEAAVGLRRSMIYKLVQEGSFPAPVKLSSRSVGWRSSDIAQWLAARSAAAA